VGSWFTTEYHPYLEFRPGCLTCPPNSHSPAASSLAMNCTCNKGFSGPGGGGAGCFVCPLGTHKPATGSAACSVTAWSIKAIGQSTPFATMNNTITVTLLSTTHDSLAGSTVTITGLTGSETNTTATLPVTSTDDALGTRGDWDSDGTLVLTVAGGKTLDRGSEYTAAFELVNSGRGQNSPSIRIEATLKDMFPVLCTGCYGNITVGTVAWVSMDKPGQPLYGVGNGADPLFIVQPYFSVKEIGQSNPFVFARNTITVTLQSLASDIPDRSVVTITGLNGSSTPSSDTFALSSTDDALGTIGEWSADGTLKLTVQAGKSLEREKAYIVQFALVNPSHALVSPPVSIEATLRDSSDVVVGEVLRASMVTPGASMYGFHSAGDPLEVVVSDECSYLDDKQVCQIHPFLNLEPHLVSMLSGQRDRRASCICRMSCI
jgi:hypothetical protein